MDNLVYSTNSQVQPNTKTAQFARCLFRARPNGEQNLLLKAKPKTNEQTSGFMVKTRMEYKRRIRVTNTNIKNENESTVEMEHQH